ncbi:MAG: hypothetical protein WDN04_09450 [Rhodospirillales bacterium]
MPGSITGSTTSLDAAAIGIAGTVTAATHLTLTAGTIDETGTIVAALLTGSATGSASLIGSNQIAALGDFAAAGFTLNDTPDLAVTGTVDGGTSVAITGHRRADRARQYHRQHHVADRRIDRHRRHRHRRDATDPDRGHGR